MMLRYRANPFRKMMKLCRDGIASLILITGIFILYGFIPNRWYHAMVVESGSMQPTFCAGDLIIITRPPERPEPGTILTFMVNGNIVTHRLIDILPDGRMITKGDANTVNDNWDTSDIAIVGLYRFRMPALGWIFNSLNLKLRGFS